MPPLSLQKAPDEIYVHMKHSLCSQRHPLGELNCQLRSSKMVKEDGKGDAKKDVIQELQGSGGRKRLRRTATSR